MTTWPDLERALQARPGWRRSGVEWRGPCPLGAGGTDPAWFGPGRDGNVIGGCHRHGGPLSGVHFAAHLHAVTGEPDRAGEPFPGWRPDRARVSGSGAPRRDDAPSPDPSAAPAGESLSRRIWALGADPAGSPGWRYLVHVRRVWPADLALPVSVRWVQADLAGDLRPRLPDKAAGALLYRYEGGGGVTLACEAVTPDGAPLAFGGRIGKRPNLARSGWDGDGGRRVFVAWPPGDQAAGLHVCEGPLDAMALVHLAGLGAVDLAGAAVIGVQCAGRMLPDAVDGFEGPVTVWPHDDAAGERAAGRLASALPGRVRVRWRSAGPGRDLADWAAEAALEREAMQDG